MTKVILCPDCMRPFVDCACDRGAKNVSPETKKAIEEMKKHIESMTREDLIKLREDSSRYD